MVEKVLKRITEAEIEAAGILKDAEKAVRKIEERNYTDIEKVRNETSSEIIKAVKKLEQNAIVNQENITVSIATPTQQKIKSAKDFIIDAIIGGTL